MTTPRRTALRFRERAELLDFLLEVSRISSETLDLAEQLSTIASIVKEVVPYDVFAILCTASVRTLSLSGMPSATAKKLCAACRFRSAKASSE